MKRLLLALALLCVGPAFAEKPELSTNVYVVPPTFLSLEPDRRDADRLRPTAREILAGAWIEFPEGASAIYNPATSQLLVRTTDDQMALVEAYVDTIRKDTTPLVWVTVREFEFAEKPELFADFGGPGPGLPARNSSRLNDKRASFLESLSRPPQAISGAKHGIIGVLTDRQFEAILARLAKELKREGPNAEESVIGRSGAPQNP